MSKGLGGLGGLEFGASQNYFTQNKALFKAKESGAEFFPG